MTKLRLTVPRLLVMGLTALGSLAALGPASGCQLIVFPDTSAASSTSGSGGGGNGGSPTAGGNGGTGGAGGAQVCDPAVCDALDEECLDFSCNADNTACDDGVPVEPGQPCLMTTSNGCNDSGMCVPIDCDNMILDGDETDIDCGGVNSCGPCDNGLNCLVDSDCLSNSCDMNGTCQPCSDAAGDCDAISGSYCDDENASASEQICKPQLASGTPCDAATHGDEECASDHCVAGICCNSGCSGLCEQCDMIGFEGLCTVVAMGTTCRPSAGGCDVAEVCDGASTACPPDGFIADNQPSTMDMCSPYLCDGTMASCPTSCAGNEDCVSGLSCAGNTCQ